MDIENLSKKSNEKVEKVEKVKEVEPETDIQKLIDQRLSFFFRNNQPPAAPQPPISTVQTMKTKMVETMAVASLTLIPILCRLVFSKIYPTHSTPQQQEPQHASINTQHMPNF